MLTSTSPKKICSRTAEIKENIEKKMGGRANHREAGEGLPEWGHTNLCLPLAQIPAALFWLWLPASHQALTFCSQRRWCPKAKKDKVNQKSWKNHLFQFTGLSSTILEKYVSFSGNEVNEEDVIVISRSSCQALAVLATSAKTVNQSFSYP